MIYEDPKYMRAKPDQDDIYIRNGTDLHFMMLEDESIKITLNDTELFKIERGKKYKTVDFVKVDH